MVIPWLQAVCPLLMPYRPVGFTASVRLSAADSYQLTSAVLTFGSARLANPTRKARTAAVVSRPFAGRKVYQKTKNGMQICGRVLIHEREKPIRISACVKANE
jgi:hypothetical protein